MTFLEYSRRQMKKGNAAGEIAESENSPGGLVPVDEVDTVQGDINNTAAPEIARKIAGGIEGFSDWLDRAPSGEDPLSKMTRQEYERAVSGKLPPGGDSRRRFSGGFSGPFPKAGSPGAFQAKKSPAESARAAAGEAARAIAKSPAKPAGVFSMKAGPDEKGPAGSGSFPVSFGGIPGGVACRYFTKNSVPESFRNRPELAGEIPLAGVFFTAGAGAESRGEEFAKAAGVLFEKGKSAAEEVFKRDLPGKFYRVISFKTAPGDSGAGKFPGKAFEKFRAPVIVVVPGRGK